ncbi:MAG: hypothetical protein H6747_06555 [Deltaproteobacteria bacterium]|nr:hypothetical protein [Deltaproteobacteria bacterium]
MADAGDADVAETILDATDADRGGRGGCVSAVDCPGVAGLCVEGACIDPIPCDGDKVCVGKGGVCSAKLGYCVECSTQVDCSAGKACHAFRCVAAGAACSSGKDCHASGQVCDATGHCVDCLKAADCGEGALCVEQQCVVGLCDVAPSCVDLEHAAGCDASGLVPTVTACAGGHHCVDGACLPVICPAGDARCQGKSNVQVCDASGTSWSAPQPCAAKEKCVAGTCKDASCTPGAVTCGATGKIEVCNLDGLGSSEVACPPGQACVGDGCLHVICTPGNKGCDGTIITTCDAQGAALVLGQDCSKLGGGCGGSCVAGACSTEGTLCDDGNPCTKDSCDPVTGCASTPDDSLDCGVGATCFGGACLAKICQPGETICLGNSAQTCVAKGTKYAVTTDCATLDGTCSIGVCSAGVCSSSAKSCDDGNPCTDDSCNAASGCVHTALDAVLCGSGGYCMAKSCVPQVCAPGSKQCKGDAVQICDALGSTWLSGEDCAALGGSCGVGTCSDGVCKSAGVDCDDANPCTVDSCSAASGCVHAAQTGVGCGTGKVCSAGTCVDQLCAPGSTSCNGSKLQLCDASGAQFTPLGDCAASNSACVQGSCTAGACVFTGKACDDGNPCTTDSCSTVSGCIATPMVNGAECGAGAACYAGTCCSCGAGQACNEYGQCVSTASCKQRCGEYSKEAACQCDAECTKYGDCCADKDALCGACDPAKPLQCSGDNLVLSDTCVGQQKQVPCPYGCNAATLACKQDLCAGYTAAGTCSGGGFYACTAGTGSGAVPKLSWSACAANESCTEAGGYAHCVINGAVCIDGQAKCAATAGQSETCVGGKWTASPCAGCQPSGAGVICAGSVALAPVTLSMTYDRIVPNATYTAFAAAPQKTQVDALWAWVVRYDLAGDAGVTLDIGKFSAGKVTLNMPKQPIAGRDYVVVGTVGHSDSGDAPRFSVLEPAVGDGEVGFDKLDALEGKPYAWALPVADAVATGTWHLAASQRAWALNIHQRYHRAFADIETTVYGKAGKSLAVWAREGTSFVCGACFWPGLTTTGVLDGQKAQSQIVLSTDGNDHLSEATQMHELGHWTMASFGSSPNEGGTHYIGTKVPPGMAWSEGWATYFSSIARAVGVYFSGYSDGSGGLFWVDLGAKKGSSKPMLPFEAGSPLVQFSDENRVSAALWAASHKFGNPLTNPINQPLLQGLRAKQLNDGVFTRGYFRQTWSNVQPTSTPPFYATYFDLKQTSQPATTFYDYLDALLCKSPALATSMASATAPLSFPFTKPTCKSSGAPTAPVRTRLEAGPVDADGSVLLRFVVERMIPGLSPMQIGLTLPAGATLLAGPRTVTITDDRAVAEASWRVRPASGAASFVATAKHQGQGRGFEALRTWPEATKPAPLQRLRRLISSGGKDFGRPILVRSRRD